MFRHNHTIEDDNGKKVDVKIGLLFAKLSGVWVLLSVCVLQTSGILRARNDLAACTLRTITVQMHAFWSPYLLSLALEIGLQLLFQDIRR